MKNKQPDCPTCGDNRRVHEDGDRNYWCTFCKVQFDDDPDEGGDYSTDPTRRLDRQEAWGARRKARKRPRSNRRSGRFGTAGRKGYHPY